MSGENTSVLTVELFTKNDLLIKDQSIGYLTKKKEHDKGLLTTISSDDKDIYGNNISPYRKTQIYRMRKWNKRISMANATERNLVIAMTELSRLSSQLGLPQSVSETAATIYRKSLNFKISRGRPIELMITAVLYASTRIRRVPRTLDEISKHSKYIKKDISRGYRLIIKELEISIPVPDSNDYLVRIDAEIKVTGKVTLKAKNIIQIAKEQKITVGKDPSGLAAVALYIACISEDERRTQREIADKANVTEVTIRNRYKELVKSLKFL